MEKTLSPEGGVPEPSPAELECSDTLITKPSHQGLAAPTHSLVGAAPLLLVDSALIGLELDGYVVECVLSMGGMGVVYQARHPATERRVAVKVLRPELLNRADVANRFLTEAQAMSRIVHPHIVQVLNFGPLPDGGSYLMMELVQGESLKQLLERTGRLAISDALQICKQLLSALVAAHGAGVVHRDLKPGNIMVSRDEVGAYEVKLLDFGLARIDSVISMDSDTGSFRGREGRSSTFAGTPEYIAPEQAGGFRVDAQGDLYSLGVILFEMLANRLPFIASSTWGLLHMHSFVAPPRLSALLPDVTKELEDFVDQLLMKDSAARPASAAAALLTVDALLAQGGDGTPALRGFGRRKVRTWAMGSAAALIVAVAFGTWVSSSTAAAHGAAQVDVATAVARARIELPAPLEMTATPTAATLTEVAPPSSRRDRPVGATHEATHRAASHPARAAEPKCQADETWRAAMHSQLEGLEQRALAKLPDTATASEVKLIKDRVRARSAEIRAAQGSECQQVGAHLHAWRNSLER